MRASLAATAVIMLTGLALTACGGSSNSAATAAGAPAEKVSQTVTFNLGLFAGTKMGDITANDLKELKNSPIGIYCPRSDDLFLQIGDAQRLKMRIVDKSDTEVATTFSDTSKAPATNTVDLLRNGCTVTGVFEDVPLDLDFYTFQADIEGDFYVDSPYSVASLTFSNEEMVKANWTVDAQIG